MSTNKNPWFRMYTDFLNDPKMIALAFEDQRHFIGILALKSDGALDSVVEENLMDRIVAQRLWIDHAIIREVKKRLIGAGLIDASWQPLAWDKRQFKSDSSNDRVARFRARSKGENNQENDGNDDETLLKRKSNAVDTDTDTEEEKKGKGKEKPAQAQAATLDIPAELLADFIAVRKARKAGPLTATAIKGLVREAGNAGIDLEAAVTACCEFGWQAFNAGWYAERMAKKQPAVITGNRNTNKHAAAAAAIWESE